MLTTFYLAAAQAMAMAPSGDGSTQQGSGMQTLFLLIGCGFIFYFMLIRPQKRQQRERQSMLDNIKKGDRIQTSGGLLGVVTAVEDKELTVRIAPEVRVKIARGAVAGLIKSSDSAKAPEASPPAEKPKTDKPA
ncbi:MAG: preprotein translocase subunit YajC [Deltaproteobacteria bacterium]|jgi:preprotein translocase subunit YajC|nr:preprotein translocase subunit YajC [Deltaproteobacteria bacterium]